MGQHRQQRRRRRRARSERGRPGGRIHLVLRASDSQGFAVEGGHPGRTSSSAGWPLDPRRSRPAPRSPGGRRLRRLTRLSAVGAIGGQRLLPDPRPRPSRAFLHDAAGGEADVADVDGHLAALALRPVRRPCCRWGIRGCAAPPSPGQAARCARSAGPAGWAAAALAPAVATYTGVLIADTATPAWKEAGGTITAAFAAGALASGAGVGLFAPLEESGPARRLAIASTAGEVGAVFRMEKAAGLAGETFTQGTRRKVRPRRRRRCSSAAGSWPR